MSNSKKILHENYTWRRLCEYLGFTLVFLMTLTASGQENMINAEASQI